MLKDQDMPRERLLEKGAEALSDAELLAILLRTGVPGKPVVTFARHILQQCGGLAGLLRQDEAALLSIKGLGKAKIAEILAVTELCQRYLLSEMQRDDWQFHSVDDVRQFLCLHFKHLAHEAVLVILLDQQLRFLHALELSKGSSNAVGLSFRALAKAALREEASAVIVVHNHPAESAQPSREDLQTTRQLEDFLQAIEVRLIDHFIVAGNTIISLREQGGW